LAAWFDRGRTHPQQQAEAEVFVITAMSEQPDVTSLTVRTAVSVRPEKQFTSVVW